MSKETQRKNWMNFGLSSAAAAVALLAASVPSFGGGADISKVDIDDDSEPHVFVSENSSASEFKRTTLDLLIPDAQLEALDSLKAPKTIQARITLRDTRARCVFFAQDQCRQLQDERTSYVVREQVVNVKVSPASGCHAWNFGAKGERATLVRCGGLFTQAWIGDMQLESLEELMFMMQHENEWSGGTPQKERLSK
jgi:hypothetical protein